MSNKIMKLCNILKILNKHSLHGGKYQRSILKMKDYGKYDFLHITKKED